MMKTCLICSAVVGAENPSCPECGECSFNTGVEPALSAPQAEPEPAAAPPEPEAEAQPEQPQAEPEPAAASPPSRKSGKR